MNFTNDELMILSDCILSNMDRLSECRKQCHRQETISAILTEIVELRDLNTKICAYMKE